MRVKIFKGIELEEQINSWIEEMEEVYVDFEIIEIAQSVEEKGSLIISVWFENELEEVPFLDYDQMDN